MTSCHKTVNNRQQTAQQFHNRQHLSNTSIQTDIYPVDLNKHVVVALRGR